MSTTHVGINGFGRIGRLMLRSSFKHNKGIKVISINDNKSTDYLAYLFKFDSAHGRFDGTVEYTEDSLIINGQTIKVTNTKEIKDLAWGDQGVDIVADCTGAFLTTEAAMGHIARGAKRVVLSAPAKDDTPTFVYGVNHHTFKPDMKVISNASCTTNGLAPVASIIHNNFKIVSGLMTTIHAVTSSQQTVDGNSKKDWRAGRAAGNNIIPASTGAAKAVGLVIPELKGKLTGMSFRVPTVDVSVVDLVVRTEKKTSYKEICELMKHASQNELKGILGYSNEDLVSTDILTDPRSSIFDSKAGMGIGDDFFKIITWYDNEYGYATRMLDMCAHVGKECNL